MRGVHVILSVVAVAACASTDDAGGPDGACGAACDQDTDGDGVSDNADRCPDTPAGEPVNGAGCADSQVTPELDSTFPPYQLEWTSAGELGRVDGLTWTYTGIQRDDLFHIYWVFCDETASPCGLSLNGPIDAPSESWQLSAAESDLPAGKLVFTNATSIVTETADTFGVTGRLTMTIVDGMDAPLPFTNVTALGIQARAGRFAVEIPGTAFKVSAIAEVSDDMGPWTPYLDYFDAASTTMTTVGGASVSFGGSFYHE